jgi:uridine kinase
MLVPPQFKPLFVGIAGGTGSGKSTIAKKIADGLPTHSVAVLDHDAYYHDHAELSAEALLDVNYDHPDALDNALLCAHLDALRRGEGVQAPLYDFISHSRQQQTRTLVPTPVVIVEGILVFVDPALRERLDVKIFVDTDADIRLFRRIRRDMEVRGRSFAHIREQYYRTVRPMHQQFVEPSKRWADLIIPEGGNNHVALDLVLTKLLAVTAASAALGATAAPGAPLSARPRAPSRPREGRADPAGRASQSPPPPGG